MTARLTRTADGRSWRVTFPYDPDVVAGIKELVPPHSRRYDPADRAWYVARAYGDEIRRLLEAVFLDVEIGHERSAYTPPSNSTPATSYTVLHLQPSAPPELVEAAFKCLSKLYHPDRGGDTEKMQALNEAVSILRRRVAS
jgi:hypothetical protein